MKSNILSVFISECFEHVYKELNGEADTLRKEGLQLAEGSRLWSEIKDCHILHEHISASSNGDSYDIQYSEVMIRFCVTNYSLRIMFRKDTA